MQNVTGHPRVVRAWDDVMKALARYQAVIAEVMADDRKTDEALREWCQWHFGDPTWAEQILEVISDPEAAIAEVKKERDG